MNKKPLLHFLSVYCGSEFHHNWAVKSSGHVTRVEEVQNAYKTLARSTERLRVVGRIILRCKLGSSGLWHYRHSQTYEVVAFWKVWRKLQFSMRVVKYAYARESSWNPNTLEPYRSPALSPSSIPELLPCHCLTLSCVNVCMQSDDEGSVLSPTRVDGVINHKTTLWIFIVVET
jgi:hypothetical protein